MEHIEDERGEWSLQYTSTTQQFNFIATKSTRALKKG
jgi:hypothetical protein